MTNRDNDDLAAALAGIHHDDHHNDHGDHHDHAGHDSHEGHDGHDAHDHGAAPAPPPAPPPAAPVPAARPGPPRPSRTSRPTAPAPQAKARPAAPVARPAGPGAAGASAPPARPASPARPAAPSVAGSRPAGPAAVRPASPTTPSSRAPAAPSRPAAPGRPASPVAPPPPAYAPPAEPQYAEGDYAQESYAAPSDDGAAMSYGATQAGGESEAVVDDDDAVIVPAPPMEYLAHTHHPAPAPFAGPRIPRYQRLEQRRTIIPILLTSGLGFLVLGLAKWVCDPDAPLARQPMWVTALAARRGRRLHRAGRFEHVPGQKADGRPTAAARPVTQGGCRRPGASDSSPPLGSRSRREECPSNPKVVGGTPTPLAVPGEPGAGGTSTDSVSKSEEFYRELIRPHDCGTTISKHPLIRLRKITRA